jgi:hypothetical protein
MELVQGHTLDHVLHRGKLPTAVTGLSGNGLVLRNNAGNDLAVAGGSFTFSAALTSGAVQRHGCDSTRR